MKICIEVKELQWTQPFLSVIDTCEFDLVPRKNADLLVKPASAINEEDLKSGIPIIALEKTDGANIEFRDILKHPNVIRYVKMFNYTDFSMHNKPCVDGRLFTQYLPYYTEMVYPAINIDENDYKKIVCGWSYLHYFRLRDILSLDTEEMIQKDDHRPFDVFFAGSLDYNNNDGMLKSADMISAHRKNCVNVLDSIKGHQIVNVKGKLLSLKDYNQITCNSKVIVSPWGWGEPCYRDYEALAAGCVLIKPITNFVRSSCAIFEKPYCVWCRPDFSDLEEKIDLALSTFKETRDGRIENRSAMIRCAQDIRNIVRNCLTV